MSNNICRNSKDKLFPKNGILFLTKTTEKRLLFLKDRRDTALFSVLQQASPQAMIAS